MSDETKSQEVLRAEAWSESAMSTYRWLQRWADMLESQLAQDIEYEFARHEKGEEINWERLKVGNTLLAECLQVLEDSEKHTNLALTEYFRSLDEYWDAGSRGHLELSVAIERYEEAKNKQTRKAGVASGAARRAKWDQDFAAAVVAYKQLDGVKKPTAAAIARLTGLSESRVGNMRMKKIREEARKR